MCPWGHGEGDHSGAVEVMGGGLQGGSDALLGVSERGGLRAGEGLGYPWGLSAPKGTDAFLSSFERAGRG